MRTPRPDRSAAFGVPPPALSERALLADGLYERLTPWHKPDVAARDGRCSSRQGRCQPVRRADAPIPGIRRLPAAVGLCYGVPATPASWGAPRGGRADPNNQRAPSACMRCGSRDSLRFTAPAARFAPVSIVGPVVVLRPRPPI